MCYLTFRLPLCYIISSFFFVQHSESVRTLIPKIYLILLDFYHTFAYTIASHSIFEYRVNALNRHRIHKEDIMCSHTRGCALSW